MGKPHQSRHAYDAKVHSVAHQMANEKRGQKTGQPIDHSKNSLAKERYQAVAGEPRTHASHGRGLRHVTVEKTRQSLASLVERPMGLVAEHLVDYHVLRKEGGQHPHGSDQPQPMDSKFRKVNVPMRPTELIPADFARMFTSGIDSLWERKGHAKPYLVVEAKGRLGAPSVKTDKAAKDSNNTNAKIPPLPKGHTLTADQAQLWRLLHDTSDKGATGGAMQMSRAWIKNDLKNHGLENVKEAQYERRVYLVASIANAQAPKVAEGVTDHLNAVAQAPLNGGNVDHSLHAAHHGVSKEYLEGDIATVENARKDAKKSTAKKDTSTPKPATSKPGAAKPNKFR